MVGLRFGGVFFSRRALASLARPFLVLFFDFAIAWFLRVPVEASHASQWAWFTAHQDCKDRAKLDDIYALA